MTEGEVEEPLATVEAEESRAPLASYRIASLVKREDDSRAALKNSLVGNIDSSYFFRPLSGYFDNAKGRHHLRYRRNFEFVPLFLNILFGFQHACSAIMCIVGPGIWLRTSVLYEFQPQLGRPFEDSFHYYTLQSAVIIAGFCTILNCMQIDSLRMPFQIGTGLTSILINSVVFVPVYLDRMKHLISEDEDSLHDAFGKMLGTTAVCSLAYVALAWIPRRRVRRVIPPFVSAIVLVHVGLYMLVKVVQFWGGGVLCAKAYHAELPCIDTGSVHLLFGSGEYLGLGLLVILVFLVCELFGSAFIRHNIVTVSVVSVGIVSLFLRKDGNYYFSGDNIDDAPPLGFLWTTTYKLGFDKKAVLPILGAFLVTYLESIAILEGTLEESKTRVDSPEAEKIIHGGLVVGSFMSFLAPLATGIPVVPSSTNNTIILATGQAPNSIGIAAGIWLLIFGVFGKLLAIFLDVPEPLKGGIGMLLECGVIWTGLKILFREKWDRRLTIITIFAFAFGLAGICEPLIYNDDHLWKHDDDMSAFAQSLRLTIVTMLQVPYLVSGFVAILLHLLLPKRMEIAEDNDELLETYEPVDDDY